MCELSKKTVSGGTLCDPNESRTESLDKDTCCNDCAERRRIIRSDPIGQWCSTWTTTVGLSTRGTVIISNPKCPKI